MGYRRKKQAAKYGVLPGDLRFKDLNNDGVINFNDKTIIGNGLPNAQGALINTFKYKNLQLLINLQYELGNDINWMTKSTLFSRTGNVNSLESVLKKAWTPENQDTKVAQIRPLSGYIFWSRAKSTWIYNGSYLRAERISLSYTFPPRLLSKMNIKSLRIYLTAKNLFVITSYPGYDPEISSRGLNFAQGVDFYAYPKPQTFQFGVSISL